MTFLREDASWLSDAEDECPSHYAVTFLSFLSVTSLSVLRIRGSEIHTARNRHMRLDSPQPQLVSIGFFYKDVHHP